MKLVRVNNVTPGDMERRKSSYECIHTTLKTENDWPPCHLIYVARNGPWLRLTATLHPNECSGSETITCIIHLEHGSNAGAYRPMVALINSIPSRHENVGKKGALDLILSKKFFSSFSHLSASSLYAIDHIISMLL